MGTFRGGSQRKGFATLSEQMQRLLEDFISCKSPLNLVVQPVWRPPTDVYETETHYVVRVDIAGVNENEIEITYHPQTSILRIMGKRMDGYPQRKIGFSQMEMSFGFFQREVELPQTIDVNGITRSYVNGLLTIEIPKSPAAITRKVPIKVKE